MKLKIKKRITQYCRQQRSMYNMQRDLNMPVGATHFDQKHKVYYKQDGDKWFYFENGWGESWEKVTVKIDLVKIESVGMEANEFIKKYGWEKAMQAWNEAFDVGNCTLFNYESHNLNIPDLTGLLLSKGLVELYGGIDKSHEFALNVWRLNKNDPFIEKMKQAIVDVESCQ